MLCNRMVGMHNRGWRLAKHKCPHGERCSDIRLGGRPDCDKCAAQRWQPLGRIAHDLLGMQSQYASHYIDGRHGSPNCGAGLRWKGDPTDYHNVRIHPADVDDFVMRVRKALSGNGQPPTP